MTSENFQKIKSNAAKQMVTTKEVRFRVWRREGRAMRKGAASKELR